MNLSVNEIALERINQKKSRRSSDSKDPNVIKNQPFNSGDMLGVNRGEIWDNFAAVRGGVGAVGPLED